MGTPVVRGKRLRVIKTDRCGFPQAGPKNQIVTKGFSSIKFANNWKDGEDLEQTNADGENCVSDRTAPELKYTQIDAVFCDVDIELFHLFTGNSLILDYDDKPIGFWQDKKVNVDFGVSVELWSGTAGSDCEEPLDDSYLLPGNSARKYGYWVAPAIVEATLGDIEIGASVATFTLSGRALFAPAWGKGPFEVVPGDDDNTPSRLLEPIGKDRPWGQLFTTIEPPAITAGATAVVLPTPYFAAVTP